MSDLSFLEKKKLERRFRMGGGYVLDFSDRTFQEFVLDTCGENMWDSKYHYASGSKANRLRAFWKREPNYIVGRLIAALLEYCGSGETDSEVVALHGECEHIAERLLQSAPVPDLEALTPTVGDRQFEILFQAIREAIDRNEPEQGLDRLHTFVVRYVRLLCDKHGIETGPEKPLHGMFGEYVKTLKRQGLIHSNMTERILKSCIATLEAFNHVRNRQSLAHDNPILNYDESLLIFNHVVTAVGFIAKLEERPNQQPEQGMTMSKREDPPF